MFCIDKVIARWIAHYNLLIIISVHYSVYLVVTIYIILIIISVHYSVYLVVTIIILFSPSRQFDYTNI